MYTHCEIKNAGKKSRGCFVGDKKKKKKKKEEEEKRVRERKWDVDSVIFFCCTTHVLPHY